MDKELLKAFLNAVEAFSPVLGTALMILLLYLRGKDKKVHTEQGAKMEEGIKVLTQKYAENISKPQAEQLVELTFIYSSEVLHCWFCRYIDAGKPLWTEGDWNLELTIKSQKNMIKGRLNVFKYKGEVLGELVDDERFLKLIEEFTKGIKTFACTDGLSRYVNNKLDEVKQEVTDKLQ